MNDGELGAPLRNIYAERCDRSDLI